MAIRRLPPPARVVPALRAVVCSLRPKKLPNGFFTRVRHYGMSANRHRAAYLQKCRELLGIDDQSASAVDTEQDEPASEPDGEQADRWDLEDEGPAAHPPLPQVWQADAVS